MAFFSTGPVVDLFGVEPAISHLPPVNATFKQRVQHETDKREQRREFHARAKELRTPYRDFKSKAHAEAALAVLQPHFKFPLRVFTYAYL